MLHAIKRSMLVSAFAFAGAGLSGCYVVPVNPDGTAAVPVAVIAAPTPAPVVAGSTAPYPAMLQARLYPANEIATRTGMLSGTVTNMMTGKGRFQLDYAGETLVGEATRAPGGERAGLANAYGQRGTFMSCNYRMTTPWQGTGICELSTGAVYQVHIGA